MKDIMKVKDEIKKIIVGKNERRVLYTAQEGRLPEVQIDYTDSVIDALESYISSHYIAKEKLETLKMNKYYSQIAKDTVRDYDHGYNDCVSEINKSIDLMLEETNE